MDHHVLFLSQYKEEFISAAVGKPTYPVCKHIVKAQQNYWNNISQQNQAIDYGSPHGDQKYMDIAAQALTYEYNLQRKFKPEDIVFTLGGIGAIDVIIIAIDKHHPKGKIVTPLPFYSAYLKTTKYQHSKLHYIDLIKSGNLTLTCEALKQSLKQINIDDISAFLFCDPNNPSGTSPCKEEWKKIEGVLKKYPGIPIILDEAYREMVFDNQTQSMITCCPDLMDRIVLLRSATKGLSAAGERMALIASKNKKILDLVIDLINEKNYNIPISLQHAYSIALFENRNNYAKMANFYRVKVDYVRNKFKQLDILPKLLVQELKGGFYVIADFTKLKGKKLNCDAQEALIDNKNGLINYDFEIVYHFLMKKNLAITPLSYFGADPSLMLVRITCSDPLEILDEMVNKIKDELEEI